MTKQSKGITLVALVITIVILLILAGISIAQLTGNGLLKRAKEAKVKNEISKAKEEVSLAISTLTLENYDNVNRITPKMIVEQVNKDNDRDAYVENEEIFPTNVIYPSSKSGINENIKIEIDGNLQITKIETENGETIGEGSDSNEGQTDTSQGQSPVLEFNIIVDKIDSNSIDISYVTTSNSGTILRYLIIVNGEYIDTTDKTTYKISNLLPETKYMIKVIAVDSEGNTRTSSTTQTTLEITSVYLFNRGTVNTSLVGNWILNGQANVTKSITDEYMEFHTSSVSYSYGTLMTDNKINCMGYSRIRFKVRYVGPYYSNVTFGISTTKDVDRYYSLSYLKSESVSSVQNTENEYVIDISDMNGEYYIGFSGVTYGFRIYEVLLEK